MSAVVSALGSGRPRVSFELVPPVRGGDPAAVLSAVDALMAADPAFISVTDHPCGRYWKDEGGVPVAAPTRGKPGTLGLCVAVRERSGAVVVPHVVCIGNDRFRAEDEFIDLRYAGFGDVFAVRGDERYSALSPGAELPGAVDLVRLASELNRGHYCSGREDGLPAGLGVGVAGYPEKHPCSPNPEADMDALARKVGAGAHWVLTQMLFDAGLYRNYVERARAAGVTVPVIPGVKALTSLRSLRSVPGAFHVTVPRELATALEEARTPAAERDAGIRFASRLVESLYLAGAPCVHFFTMGRAEDTLRTLDLVYGAGRRKGNGHES